MSTGNENLQKIKTQCTHDIKKSIRKNNTDSSATDDYGGVYSLFSCDRLNRWKAMITCTINCMGEKLGMVSAKYRTSFYDYFFVIVFSMF